MNNPQQPGFAFLPTVLQDNYYRPDAHLITNDSPARVKVAMDYIVNCTLKSMDRAAPHGIGCEVVEGQKLSPAETGTQTAACEMLKKYFHGELVPDHWEKLLAGLAVEDIRPDPGVMLVCDNCRGRDVPNPDCPLCRGEGGIVVYPNRNSKKG